MIVSSAFFFFRGEQLQPPPLDGISLVTSGYSTQRFIDALQVASSFDEQYTRLVHNQLTSVLSDTDDSDTSKSNRSDSDADYEYDRYEYDEDIYDYMEEYEN